MNANTRLSSKGQIVIPKDIRDALRLKPGETLSVTREGRRIILEPLSAPRETISYAEFKRRVPAYSGKKVSVADMRNLSSVFAEWKI